MQSTKITQQLLTKVDKSVDVKIAENNKAINNTINNVNVRVDGIKGDLNGLTKRVDQNEKDINVAGTIAIENRKFIGDNKAAIDKNTKAIEALNGKVGTTITNIESTINNKIEANILQSNKVDQISMLRLLLITQQSLTKLIKTSM